MRKDYVKYGFYFLLAVLFVLLLQLYFPNPINWNRNLNTQSKDPYGLYVFDRELPKILQQQNLKKTGQSPYEYLLNHTENPSEETTFLLIENNSTNDRTSVEKLLEEVKKGADLVLSYESFYTIRNVLDSIQMSFHKEVINNFHFVHPNLSKDTLAIKDTYNNVFTVEQPEKHQVFAKMDYQISFIATKYGKGTVYLNSTPILLTNYYLLNPTKDYSSFAEGFASVLKKQNIVWFDANYNEDLPVNQDSILRVLFQHKSLRFAWYTLIIGLLLYIIFYGKRRQRIVPVTEPLKNTTVEYVETVGNLYYQENDHTQLLDKQIKYALHFIRSQWHIPTQELNEDFKNRLMQKSGGNETDINNFMHFICNFDIHNNYSQNNLIQFSQLLEKLNIDYGTSRK